MLAKTLDLLFENVKGDTVRISLDDPIDPINPVSVNAAMDTIIQAGAFTSSGGDLVKKKGARVIERNINDISLG
ncbi:DUF2922 domain-containing protein [Scopulibacillus cellulosilyticus]|uniref:DUF2922 domain-containing protein n=1 Tax=Scopulibacillus cellulosilyticus TaxID=2665665 RepID=A0ABW2PXX2_9BACL